MYEIGELGHILGSKNFGSVGKDIFLYHSPAEAKDCIILFPSFDPVVIDLERPFYFVGKFQVIVRNDTYKDGLDICRRIQDAFTIYELETDKIIIKRCRPLHQAKVYRRSDTGMLEFSVTYEIRFVEKS